MTERAYDASPRGGDGGVPLDQLKKEIDITPGGTPRGTDPRGNEVLEEINRQASEAAAELVRDGLPPPTS